MGINITSYPFMGNVWYWREAKYGQGRPLGSTTTFNVSSKIYNARIEVPNTFKPLRGIAKPSVCAFVSTISDYTFHLEFVPQDAVGTSNCSLLYDLINRPSTGTYKETIRPLSFWIRSAVTTDIMYFYLKGCVAKNVNIKSSTGNEYIVTADFSVCSITAAASQSWTSPAIPTSLLASFNKSGAVLAKNVSAATVKIADIVDSIDVTINYNTIDSWNAGTPYKQNAVTGAHDISGTVGMQLALGGYTHWNELYTEMTDIAINFGFTRYPILRLRGAKWDGYTAELNTDGKPMWDNAKFVAKYAYYRNSLT